MKWGVHMLCEKIVVGSNTEYPLNGILTLPDDIKSPVPAVVMIHGSGPSDMDEHVMKLTPFKDLAEGLADLGVASIRYDKRTFAHKRKMAKITPTIKEETIDDAILAIEMLKNDDRIDKNRIFILGHSMGAMLAPRIDAEGGNVAGLIMLAGTPYRLEDIVIRQLKQAENGNPLVKWIIKRQSIKYTQKFANLYQMSDEEAKKTKFAGNVSLYYFKEMGEKTAVDYLLLHEKPTLIMQGERDFQVLHQQDFAGFKEMLQARPNTHFKLYPNLNHVFVDAIYDDIMKASKEYKVERHIGKEVMADITEFIFNCN